MEELAVAGEVEVGNGAEREGLTIGFEGGLIKPTSCNRGEWVVEGGRQLKRL